LTDRRWGPIVDFNSQLLWIYCSSRRNSGLFVSFDNNKSASRSVTAFEISAGGKSGKQVKHLIHLRACSSSLKAPLDNPIFFAFRATAREKWNQQPSMWRFWPYTSFSATVNSFLVVCHDSRWLKIRCQCLQYPVQLFTIFVSRQDCFSCLFYFNDTQDKGIVRDVQCLCLACH